MLETSTSSLFANISKQERANLKRLVDYSHLDALPEVWSRAGKKFGDNVALRAPHIGEGITFTYAELFKNIQLFASGLQSLGVNAGDCVSLIADNSPRWMIADQGIMTAGAIDAVRGSQADAEELLYILDNSGSTALIVEDIQTFEKLREGLINLPIKNVILLSDETPPKDENLKILNFSQLMELGASNKLQPVKRKREDVATLMYTSGTSGKPKGVMLSHGNLLHQVLTYGVVLQPEVGSIALSILPTWHVYERSAEYFLLSQGCMQVYTNLRAIKGDLKTFKPDYVVCVPRLLASIYEGVQKQFREQPPKKQRLINRFLNISDKYIQAQRIAQGLSLDNLNTSILQRLTAKMQASALSPLHALAGKLVYNKVREATGGNIKQMISGGGALPKHIDNFFEIIDVEILVGYGLTETSPVTHVRRKQSNLRGSSGKPLPGTEAKIVDPQTRQALPTGQQGLVLLRGPQIMQGYHRNPEATAKVIDKEGWFDSGDLGWVTSYHDLVLTGRAKDTIVLSNGENIEPQPIEDACVRSPYIDQIMLVGQDQKFIGALIVPNLEALEKWAKTQNLELCLQEDNVTGVSSQKINLESRMIQDLFRQELNREVQNRPGYRPDDRIVPFKVILEPFSKENGMMTQTLKIRRHVVMKHYHDTIEQMFA